MASLTLKRNYLPLNGSCFVDKTNGTSLFTWFNIICLNWTDSDGIIAKYEFYATYKDNLNPIALNFNSNGKLSVQLPQGPNLDSYKIYLIVKNNFLIKIKI